MENLIEFINNLDQLFEIINAVILSEASQGILMSGTFDSPLYKILLDNMIREGSIKFCKILIPFVSKSGVISRPYLNRIMENGGELRINSKFNNNIIVIGKYAFILCFSYRYKREYGVKTNFESCIVTSNSDVVSKIRDEFVNKWEGSLPLINGV